MSVRIFESFAEGLRVSYEEEVSGEAFFTELAEYQSIAYRRILLLFAEMERITYTSIRHLLDKYNIEVSDDKELKRDGIAEAKNIGSCEWTAIVASMVEDYSSYIEEFRSVKKLAPTTDSDAIDVLIEHEQAMLDFAVLHTQGASDVVAPLKDFITRYGRS